MRKKYVGLLTAVGPGLSLSKMGYCLTSVLLTFAGISLCTRSDAWFCRGVSDGLYHWEVVKQENLTEVSSVAHLSVCHII